MSHRELLMEHMTAAVESGKYRAKGSPRAKEEPKTGAPHVERRVEPAKPSESPKTSKLDHGSFIRERAAKRSDEVDSSVKAGLDARFKGKK